MARGAAAVSVAVLLGASVAAQDAGDGSKPESTDLVERTGARLVQIEVNLSGPPEALDGVTRDDFRLQIGGRKITDFEVDMLCRDPGRGRSLDVAAGDVARPPEAPVPALGPATFLFYFDQQHLTLGGRQESIDILKAMIPELIRDGNRGTLVSNAAKLETLADLTTDPQVLLSALQELQGNHEHFDTDAQQEQTRIAEVLDYIGIGSNATDTGSQRDYQQALSLARQYYQDELWRAERNLRRFSMVLGSLALIDRPKAVIYFADNMRRNAGQHYLDLFGEFAKRESTGSSPMTDIPKPAEAPMITAQHPFDQVVNQAAAYGVRLYPVEGQGLETESHRAPTTKQFRDSENTLRDLAAETGGEAFLNGVRTSKIVETLQQDLSCIYLVSFGPEGLPEDVAQKVIVNVDRPKVQVHSQGRIIIQSDSARKTSRLMAAFASPKSVEGSISVHPSVVPTGYEDGKFMALVQVTVPGSEVPASTWDLGASVISKGTTREASGRLTVSQAGAPVVLQESMTFSPGPFEVVAVAHNTTVDGVGSEQFDGEWPQPNAQLASLGPIAVVQTTKGAIKRGDQTRTSAFVSFAEDEPVLADREVTLVALVCKSSDVKDDLLVERQLVGASSVHFDPIEVDLGKDPCMVIHDRIKPKTMTPGAFHYRIQVHDAKEELVRGDRRFFVWDGTTPADVGESAPTEEGRGA
jgi:VWFA-related protein